MSVIKNIIALDIDDVVADLLPEWLRRYNHDFDDNLAPEDITEWDLTKFIKKECGSRIFEYLDDANLYDNVLPVDGAISSISKLKSLPHTRVIFVTARDVADAKFSWLKTWGLAESRNDYVVCQDKGLILADYLVDDKPENIMRFSGFGILFSSNHNRRFNDELGKFWIRKTGWEEVVEYIEYRVTRIGPRLQLLKATSMKEIEGPKE